MPSWQRGKGQPAGQGSKPPQSHHSAHRKIETLKGTPWCKRPKRRIRCCRPQTLQEVTDAVGGSARDAPSSQCRDSSLVAASCEGRVTALPQLHTTSLLRTSCAVFLPGGTQIPPRPVTMSRTVAAVSAADKAGSFPIMVTRSPDSSRGSCQRQRQRRRGKHEEVVLRTCRCSCFTKLS